MNLQPHLLLKRLMIACTVGMPYLLDACQIGQEQKKIKSLFWEIVKFIQSESQFVSHIQRLTS